jgi:glycosyltransferase involved in cell wall biosynthesis
MNILMFNYEYPPLGGGGGVFNKQLAEELVKRGHMVTVVTSLYGAQQQRETINDVEIVRVPILSRGDQNAASHMSMLSYFPASLYRGSLLLKNRVYDLIHTFFAIPTGPSALLLSTLFRTPHLLSLLGGDVYDPSKKLSPHKTPVLHYTVKRVMELSDRVVALSSDIQNRAIRHYNPSKTIDLIHLGIPEPRVESIARGTLGYSTKDIVLATVGRLVRRKGLRQLLQSLKRINNPQVKLAVIGDGPEKSGLVDLMTALGLEKQINFFGYVSDEMKYQILTNSDVYVSTSEHEGFGIVFLEAMAAGLPVICFDKGGQADFLKDNQTGFLIQYGNFDHFDKQLAHLCNLSAERHRFKIFNKVYVKEFFIERCADRYLKAYKSLVKPEHQSMK